MRGSISRPAGLDIAWRIELVSEVVDWLKESLEKKEDSRGPDGGIQATTEKTTQGEDLLFTCIHDIQWYTSESSSSRRTSTRLQTKSHKEVTAKSEWKHCYFSY